MFARNLLGATLAVVMSLMAFDCYTAVSANMAEPAARTQLPLGKDATLVSFNDIKSAFLITKN